MKPKRVCCTLKSMEVENVLKGEDFGVGVEEKTEGVNEVRENV